MVYIYLGFGKSKLLKDIGPNKDLSKGLKRLIKRYATLTILHFNYYRKYPKVKFQTSHNKFRKFVDNLDVYKYSRTGMPNSQEFSKLYQIF